MRIRIIPAEQVDARGALATAEFLFDAGPLEGLRLIGFTVFQRPGGNQRHVTFPARTYSINGERRSYSLLRPAMDPSAQDRISEAILNAFARQDQDTFAHVDCRKVTFKIEPNDRGNPPGKLGDVEMVFMDGLFAGLKLIGFSVWERRGAGGRNVTFPARVYSVNGERRSFALLRPAVDIAETNRVRDLVVEAFAEFEAQSEAAAAL